MRGRLADAQHGGTVPPFTVSFGIAPGEADLTFGQVVEEADALLLRAKAEGRDRVEVVGGHQDASELESSGDADTELHPIS
ncbi:MAG TPA: GGDEF domain-containing protein [Acidimicrobiales bacterium]|nr:GGDEF domain-containing protein [Acidimicrobiales bacterium]